MFNDLQKKIANKWFDYVVDQDFNPDFVKLYGLDCAHSGIKAGVVIGAATIVMIGTIAGAIVTVVKSNKDTKHIEDQTNYSIQETEKVLKECNDTLERLN